MLSSVEHDNPLNVELNSIRHLLALTGAHHFVDVSRLRVKPSNLSLKSIKHTAVGLFLEYRSTEGSVTEGSRIWVL
jgi:hypothetical protein